MKTLLRKLYQWLVMSHNRRVVKLAAEQARENSPGPRR